MLTSIIEGFKKVKDFRHKRGKRHELWVVLSIIFLGLMTGNVNYKQNVNKPINPYCSFLISTVNFNFV